jgi:hypothetical protein
MCDSKCFFGAENNLADLLSSFQKKVLEIQNYIISDLEQAGVIVKEILFDVKGFDLGLQAGVNQKIFFKPDYLLYIYKYGVPSDGIWDPNLLAEFENA